MTTEAPKRPVTPVTARPQPQPLSYVQTRPSKQRRGGPLGWWYRLAAPVAPPQNASIEQLDVFRRGRLASIILLVINLFAVLAIPSIVLFSPAALPLHLLSLAANITAVFFNRAGKVTAAGLLVVSSLTISLMFSIAFTGNTVSGLTLFQLLILPEIIAVSLLPASFVFLFALINSLFVFAFLSFVPHASDLERLLSQFRYGLIIEPVFVFFGVAVIAYLWVSGANQAIRRADRAELIAELERRENERRQEEIERKRQLDLGIEQILQTHIRAANGDFTARVPLTQDNILWRVAKSLNNLLARLQDSNQNSLELERARQHAVQLAQDITSAKQSEMPFQSRRRGTIIDEVVLALWGCTIRGPLFKTSYPTGSLQKKRLTS